MLDWITWYECSSLGYRAVLRRSSKVFDHFTIHHLHFWQNWRQPVMSDQDFQSLQISINVCDGNQVGFTSPSGFITADTYLQRGTEWKTWAKPIALPFKCPARLYHAVCYWGTIMLDESLWCSSVWGGARCQGDLRVIDRTSKDKDVIGAMSLTFPGSAFWSTHDFLLQMRDWILCY